MNLKRRNFLRAAGLTALGVAVPAVLAEGRAVSGPLPAKPTPSMPAPVSSADRPPLLDKAIAALDRHSAKGLRRDIVGLVNFSAHSSEERFEIVDVANGEVLSRQLVAHGRGSDPAHTGYLRDFSNVMGSNASSRGAFRIANTYFGKYGRSRRLDGLDMDNDLALERAIVIHGASYVSPHLIESQGRIGRSYGCFSVEESRIEHLLDTLGENCLLFADLG